MLPQIKGKPLPIKGKPAFTRDQVADDTERDMRGRGQRFGAAVPDEEANEGEPAEPGAEDEGQEQATIESLQAENEELKSRLEKVEAHLGLNKPAAPAAPAASVPEAEDAQGFGEES